MPDNNIVRKNYMVKLKFVAALLILAVNPAYTETYTINTLIYDRYQNNSDGTVTDIETKLTWMRCSIGQTWTGNTCLGEAKKFNWEEGKTQTLNFTGYSDWRVPTIKELRTLVYCSSGKPDYFNPELHDLNKTFSCEGDYKKPTIVEEAFPNTPSASFLSSELVVPAFLNIDMAWSVNFELGLYGGSSVPDMREEGEHVCLVRKKQPKNIHQCRLYNGAIIRSQSSTIERWTGNYWQSTIISCYPVQRMMFGDDFCKPYDDVMSKSTVTECPY